MFTVILYSSALLLLAFSFFRDREKTKSALKKTWRSFENILPSMLSILLLIGLILSVLDEKTISRMIGTQSGALGIIIAAVIGCITLLPGYVAIPLAASLVQAGAGYAQIAIFISTLMMVGVATFPLEVNYFGRKFAFRRNALSLAVAIISACLIGVIME
ncbi:permease [Clostridium sp. chh4-2]|uniref:permease n=1 Tax=Clostridium sp. chh4-2 TaxID=2067550 RepID=UPI000CCF21A4|nr:permease [Clostridium sp. chh4-2]PNV61436.1 permease [Clostridium sp. chh4-2]